MTARLNALLSDPPQALELSARGLETIQRRHTCSHRVDELLAIVANEAELTLAERTSAEGAR